MLTWSWTSHSCRILHGGSCTILVPMDVPQQISHLLTHHASSTRITIFTILLWRPTRGSLQITPTLLCDRVSDGIREIGKSNCRPGPFVTPQLFHFRFNPRSLMRGPDFLTFVFNPRRGLHPITGGQVNGPQATLSPLSSPSTFSVVVSCPFHQDPLQTIVGRGNGDT